MTIKRYSIDSDAQNKLTVKQTSVGDFVSYSDYEALKAKMDMVHNLMTVAEQANTLAKESVEQLRKERDEARAGGVYLAIEELELSEFGEENDVKVLRKLLARLRKESGK